MQLGAIALVLALSTMSVPAAAEVVGSTPQGFASINERTVAAGQAEVWQALTDPARYWSAEHSWFGDAGGLSLVLEPGGCFCESATGAGNTARFAEHARTVMADAPRMLRLRGALGPLQGEALTGTLTVTLEPVGSGTAIRWEYVVGGHARFDLEQVAPAVDAVMAEQLTRLVALIENAVP